MLGTRRGSACVGYYQDFYRTLAHYLAKTVWQELGWRGRFFPDFARSLFVRS